MWNQTKNQWNSSNGQLHWFPIDFLWKWTIIDQNYANSNVFFSDWNFSEVSRVCHRFGNLTSRAFWKCGSFCCYNFLNRSYGCSKSTESEILAMLAKIRVVKKKLTLSPYCKLRLEINMSKKNVTATILRFKLPYWISVSKIGMFRGWFNGRT